MGGLEATVVSSDLHGGGSYELVCRYCTLCGICWGMGLEDSVWVVFPLKYLVSGWIECDGSRGVKCQEVEVQVKCLDLGSGPIGVGIGNVQDVVILDIGLDVGVLIWVCVS